MTSEASSQQSNYAAAPGPIHVPPSSVQGGSLTASTLSPASPKVPIKAEPNAAGPVPKPKQKRVSSLIVLGVFLWYWAF